MPAVGAALSAVFTSFSAGAVGSFLTTNIVGRLLTSVALSALSRALAPKPKAAGIATEVTQSGGSNPAGFVLGRYATGGSLVCPPLTHGKAGKTPNAYLTYVIAFSDLQGNALNASQLVVNDEQVTINTGSVDPTYGNNVTGRYAGYMWVKWYDGSQIAADAMLLSKYGAHPDYPWTSDMIGRGVAYAIVTFRFERKLFNGLPRVLFVVDSLPLYDPRLDSTAGGSGPQRWNNTATWAYSENPAVMIYNILRGITLYDGSIWGGRAVEADLPASNWFAAMNACDAAVAVLPSGTTPRFRAGLEVTVDQQPVDVIDELQKACSAAVTEFGGVYKIRVGGPGAPVMSFTDDDLLISESESFAPFQGLQETFNGIHARYPEPTSLWETKEAPPRYNAAYEAQDDGRRLIADLDLPAVPFARQVQRLMAAWIKEERRFRRHVISLPQEAAILEPLDTISWTSVRNGYTTKLFEITALTDQIDTLAQSMAIFEKDANDYNWSTGDELPSSPSVPAYTPPAVMVVSGFDVAAAILQDAGGTGRRAALSLTWDPSDLDDIPMIEYEVELNSTQTLVKRGSSLNVLSGLLRVADGIIGGQVYRARMRLYHPKVQTNWTGWQTATAPTISGIAFVGGDLRSNNFVAGVSGWNLTAAGNLEANNLIVRGSIQAGAVSDEFQAVDLGPRQLVNNVLTAYDNVVVANIQPGWIFKRGFTFEARTAGFSNWTMTLQIRKRIAGVWGPYSDVATITVDTADWDVYASSGTFAGQYDDVDYRALYFKNDVNNNGMNLLRNSYITVARVTL